MPRLMPLDLADALYQHLLDRFPADRDYPRGALYVEGMPPLVASLLGRTLDRWLEHELDALESRWFDFDDPGVRAARAELVLALGRTARVPRGAWAETLRYAVGAVVRHLVTPARALTDATFEGQTESLPTEIVRSRLHTFEAYPYLPEIADAYLAKKGRESVDPETFHGLLLRIDRRVTGEYSVEDWLRLLGPLFKLARRVPDLRGLPPHLLEEFFAARGQNDVAAALSKLGERPVDESALHELLAKTIGDGTLPPPAEKDLVAATPAAGESPAAEPAPAQTADLEDEAETGHVEPSAEPEARETPGKQEEVAEQLEEEVAEQLEEGAEEQEEVVAERLEEEVAEQLEEEGAEQLEKEVAEQLEKEVAEQLEKEVAEQLEKEVARGAIADRMSDSPAVMPAPPDEPQPLWKRFAGSSVGPTVETSIPGDQAVAVPSSGEHTADEHAAESRPLWRRFLTGIRGETGGASGQERPAQLPEHLPEPPSLENLERRVLGRAGGRLRIRYVRDLFGGDEHAYATVLQELDRCESWSEASQVIATDVFRRFGVDIYSATAVEFTDAVNAGFGR